MVNSSFDSGAVVPNSGLEVTAGGQMKIPNGGIKTALLETGAIDASKISTGGPSWTASSVSLPSNTSVSGTVTATGFVGPLTGNVTGSTVTSGTAVTASGSSVTFGSIPSWVTEVTILFYELSTNGSNDVYIRVGSGGTLQSTNYFDSRTVVVFDPTPSLGTRTSTTGVELLGNSSGSIRSGSITFKKLGSSNIWMYSIIHVRTEAGAPRALGTGSGYVTLSGNLDIAGISVATNTFDSGTVNVIYQ
jgi:hypothetical protein